MAAEDVESMEAAFSANEAVASMMWTSLPQIREKSCALQTNYGKKLSLFPDENHSYL